MKVIEKYFERKNESENLKVERFYNDLKKETETQIENLRKENKTLKESFETDKTKTDKEITELTEQIEDYLTDIDIDKVKDKDSRKEYKKDFICGYMDLICEIETKNKKVKRLEETLNEKLEDNNDSILKLQSFLNELK